MTVGLYGRLRRREEMVAENFKGHFQDLTNSELNCQIIILKKIISEVEAEFGQLYACLSSLGVNDLALLATKSTQNAILGTKTEGEKPNYEKIIRARAEQSKGLRQTIGEKTEGKP